MTEARVPDRLIEALRETRIVPVLTLDDTRWAADLAHVLWDSGVRVIEVTLRTAAALDVLRAMADAVPEAIVGAGTVLSAQDLAAARSAGAKFAVSPGQTEELLAAARRHDLAFIPGVATPSEMMHARASGHVVQKLFPAEVCGGTALLNAVRDPLPDVLFWPTGGIGQALFADYLAQPNVLAVGSSRVVPAASIRTRDIQHIRTCLAGARADCGS